MISSYAWLATDLHGIVDGDSEPALHCSLVNELVGDEFFSGVVEELETDCRFKMAAVRLCVTFLLFFSGGTRVEEWDIGIGLIGYVERLSYSV